MLRLFRKAITLAYRELVYDRRRETTFWMLAAFVPTFLVARLLVYADPSLFLNVRGTHIHHFTYGFFLLAAVGYVAIAYPDKPRRFLAFVYGIGLALAADEFGMWLRLRDQYDARHSYDAILAIGTFLIGVVYFADFFSRAARYLRQLLRRR